MSQPIRIALLGCGGIQAKHVRTFLERKDARIVAMCDTNDAMIDALVERVEAKDTLGDVPRFGDPAAMYAAVEADGVSICTPHTLHFAQAMQALGAGLHVLLEKPMVTSAPDAHTLAAETIKAGKVLIVAYNTPCSPELAYIRELIRTQELGKLELVTGWLSQGWMKGTAGKWRQDPALSGGGQAYDSGAHPIASLVWTIESDVEEVYAMVDNHGTPVDINSAFIVRFANGVIASMTIGGNCPGNDCDMAMIFDNGRIRFNPWQAKDVRVWKGKDELTDLPIDGKPVSPADNFLDSIQGTDTPRSTARTGIIHSELMDLIYESAAGNAPARAKR